MCSCKIKKKLRVSPPKTLFSLCNCKYERTQEYHPKFLSSLGATTPESLHAKSLLFT
jgi:hypothetical protein